MIITNSLINFIFYVILLLLVAKQLRQFYHIIFNIHQGDLIMVIHESAEDYLETILILSKKLPVVRSIDIANEMGYKKSSVSIAMKNLRESEHIRVTKEGYIYLTDSGKEIAEMIYERHQLLSSWLIKLGVDKTVAEEDACRIEHDISKESFNAIKKAISMQMPVE